MSIKPPIVGRNRIRPTTGNETPLSDSLSATTSSTRAAGRASSRSTGPCRQNAAGGVVHDQDRVLRRLGGDAGIARIMHHDMEGRSVSSRVSVQIFLDGHDPFGIQSL